MFSKEILVKIFKITHKGFSADIFKEILPETLLSYAGERKVFRKYSRLDRNLFISMREFDAKDRSSVIAIKFRSINPFSF